MEGKLKIKNGFPPPNQVGASFTGMTAMNIKQGITNDEGKGRNGLTVRRFDGETVGRLDGLTAGRFDDWTVGRWEEKAKMMRGVWDEGLGIR